MFKYLIDQIKIMKGNILTIGIDDKLLSGFNRNNTVNVYTLDRAKGIFGKSKKRKDKEGKTINIKRLRKYFHKKRLDYVIVDYDEIKDYLKYVMRDLVYLNNNKLYLYGVDEDSDLIEKRFKRYKANCLIKRFKDHILIEVDNSKSRTNWFLNKVYYISDTIYNFVDFVSNILIS